MVDTELVEVLESLIHGHGVFAAVDLEAGEELEISYVVLDDDDTDTIWNNSFGGWYPSPEIPWAYLNHSDKPNAEMNHEGQDMFLLLLRDIKAGEEIVIDYGEDYNWKLA